MKTQALENIVHKYVYRIEKYSNRLPGSFNKEDIHDLRVNYKKLRAFVRLLRVHLPPPLKVLYHCCGDVRDRQLLLQQLQEQQFCDQLPCFVNKLQQHLFVYKEQAVLAIEQLHFKKVVAGIAKQLPPRLRNADLEQFLHLKTASINILLLVADNDTNLHSVRKHVKDVIYTKRIIEHDAGHTFPETSLGSDDQLNELATQLGNFNDRCLQVSLLQAGEEVDRSEDERIIIDRWQQQLIQQKRTEQQQLQKTVQKLSRQYAW